MGSHEPFGHLQHKLWWKERLGVKLLVWPPTTKSWKSTRPRCVQVECIHHWNALNKGYNFALDLILIGGLHRKLYTLKVAGVLVIGISGLPLGSPEIKKTIWMWPRGKLQSILYGGRWWLHLSLGRGESCESRIAHGLSYHQGCFKKCSNQLVVGWMQIRVSN
jgi:hypothetical protein